MVSRTFYLSLLCFSTKWGCPPKRLWKFVQSFWCPKNGNPSFRVGTSWGSAFWLFFGFGHPHLVEKNNTKVNKIIIIASPHITTTTQGRFSRLLRKRVKRFQSKNYTSSPRTDRMFFFLPCPLSRPKDEISSHCRAVSIWGAIGSVRRRNQTSS